MKIAARENFRFTDKRLLAGLLITLPWLFVTSLGIADMHRDATGIPAMMCGLLSLACVIWSIVGKTRQCLFLLVTFIVSMMVAVSPLVCVVY